MIHRGSILLVLGLWLILPLGSALADESPPAGEPDWQTLLQQLDADALEPFQQEIREELGLSPGPGLRDWLQGFVQGDWKPDSEALLKRIQNLFFRVLRQNSRLLGRLIILSALTALLSQLKTSLNGGAAPFAAVACRMSLALAALLSFQEVWQLGEKTIGRMVDFMNAMLPQMLFLTASLGNVAGSAMLYPLLMSVETAVAEGIRVIVLPLALTSVVLHIINQLTEGVRVERLAKFLTQAAQLTLGFMVTAFVGFVTVRTLYAAALDKVLLRTGKFITDNSIPIVGKMLSDTLEVAAGYIMILKQAMGIYGVILLLGLTAAPMMQMMILALLYGLSAALAEPLGDAKTAALLEKISGSLWLVTASLAVVSLIFLMMIALIVGLTNNLTL